MLRGDHQLRAAPPHGLADPQVEDRHLVQRVDPDDQDRVGVIEVGHPRAVIRPGELAQQTRIHRIGGAVEVGGTAGSEDPLDQPALLV